MFKTTSLSTISVLTNKIPLTIDNITLGFGGNNNVTIKHNVNPTNPKYSFINISSQNKPEEHDRIVNDIINKYGINTRYEKTAVINYDMKQKPPKGLSNNIHKDIHLNAITKSYRTKSSIVISSDIINKIKYEIRDFFNDVIIEEVPYKSEKEKKCLIIKSDKCCEKHNKFIINILFNNNMTEEDAKHIQAYERVIESETESESENEENKKDWNVIRVTT